MTRYSNAIRVAYIITVPLSVALIRSQVRYIKSKGFEIHVLASSGELLEQFASSESITAYSVEMPRRITPLRDIVAMFQIWQYLRSIKPHIVHSSTPKGGVLGMIGAWLANVPVRIYQVQGLPFMTAKGHKRILLRWSEKIACLLSHESYFVSPSVRDVAIKEHICPADKAKLSFNAVDGADRFNPEHIGPDVRYTIWSQYQIPSEAQVMSFLGRIVRDKGLIELVEAWKVLREEFPNLHFLVVGGFEEQDPVPEYVVDILQSDPRIHLTGHVNNIPSILSATDILVLPSYREGLPITPLEASAMEVPVVATQIPGCVDAVQDTVTGTLVPPHDSRALGDAIRMYLNDSDLRRRHGCAGRERVLREFRPEVICEAMYHEYIRLLGSNGIVIPESTASELSA